LSHRLAKHFTRRLLLSKMKASHCMACVLTFLVAVAFMGAQAADVPAWTDTTIFPTWKDERFVPGKNITLTLTDSRLSSAERKMPPESVRIVRKRCQIVTTACKVVGMKYVGAVFTTDCQMVWVIHLWEACPPGTNAWVVSPCPGFTYCAIV
jgi:hypothetical protein